MSEYPLFCGAVRLNLVMNYCLGGLLRCECGNCQVMPTARECVCCCEIDQVNEKKQETWSGSEVACIVDHESFESVCLNVWVLQAAYFAYRYHYGEVGGLTHE